MKIENKFSKSIIAILIVLLVSSSAFMLGHSAVIPDSIEGKPLSPATDYGDIMQYEWNVSGGMEGYSGFSAGPGPETADVMWKTQLSGSGFLCAFSGKLFAISGTTLRALDPFTGASIYNATLVVSGNGNGGINKIDNNNLLITNSRGIEIRRISDGSWVSNFTVPSYGSHPGSAQYFPGSYSPSMKMDFCLSYDTVAKKGWVNAIDVSDPANPKIAWTYMCNHVSEVQGSGGGMVYVGTTANTLFALNGTTGEFLWETPKMGVVQQHGMYYNGNFYQSASTQTMTCWNATTGDVTWEYDASVLGERAYFAYRGAAGYGRIYDQAIPNDPNGWVVCWDAITGELLWKQPAYYNIAYSTVALAGGKVYSSTCDQAPGRVTAGLVMPGFEFTCFDAYTGTQIWKIKGLGYTFSTPAIAYGNLYVAGGGYIYCIGNSKPSSSSAKDWAFGYIGNLEQPRIAVGQTGPEDLSKPRWVFATGAKIAGTPAVVAGKVYIGSDDTNWYCLDAYTGAKIWSFKTGYEVGASAAVLGGRVYTGADDGNFYCLDANTGAKIWQTSAGGVFKYIMMPQELQSRSSPIIIGDRLYAGAMDGKFYCLNTADGRIQWTYNTGGPIGGSPIYSNGWIYFTSTDTYLYALDTSGALKWKSIPLNLDVNVGGAYSYFCTGTPVIANGVAYVPGGVTYGVATSSTGPGGGALISGGAFGGTLRLAAFNATTGASIWNQTLAGNSGGVWQPAYVNGNLYFVENMRVSMANASNPNQGPAAPLGFSNQRAGNRTWTQWIGYQILTCVTYADDMRGAKVYVGSDVGSVTCLNASNGAPISAYQTGANVEGSPTLWEGKLYIGSTDKNVYCFDDSPSIGFNIYAEANKGGEMWNNETITIGGQLLSNPDETTWDYASASYKPVASEMHPGLPNAKITVSFTKPNMESVNVTTTTDNKGKFTVSYNPAEVGNWGWVAYYEGNVQTRLIYDAAYSTWNPISVVAAPTAPTPTPIVTIAPTPTPVVTPEPTATPIVTATPAPVDNTMTYAYVAIAVIVIVAVIAVAAFMLRKKKQA